MEETIWNAEAWLNQLFTVSSHAVLGAATAQRLRNDLAEVIGPAGVTLTAVTHVVIARR